MGRYKESFVKVVEPYIRCFDQRSLLSEILALQDRFLSPSLQNDSKTTNPIEATCEISAEQTAKKRVTVIPCFRRHLLEGL